MNIDKDYPKVIYGKYVIYPCNNQFNNKISYWISKGNCTIAFYCFSVSSYNEAEKILNEQKTIDSYISMFDARYNQNITTDRYCYDIEPIHRFFSD